MISCHGESMFLLTAAWLLGVSQQDKAHCALVFLTAFMELKVCSVRMP